jgi:RNA polymerase sigma factor (sigma-70 family)
MREYPSMPRSFAHLSDEAVVALVARSDQEALGELYDRFGRVAYGLALRVLRDEKLAEDAVQEGFLAAWRNADRFIPERAKASTWLLTFVHRRAVDLVRREERRRAEPLAETSEASGSAADDAWLKSRMFAGLARLRELLAEPNGESAWKPTYTT